jgi:hypothetical protein
MSKGLRGSQHCELPDLLLQILIGVDRLGRHVDSVFKLISARRTGAHASNAMIGNMFSPAQMIAANMAKLPELLRRR